MKTFFNRLFLKLKTWHSEQELRRAKHIVTHHLDALQDALDEYNLHVHGNPRKRARA